MLDEQKKHILVEINNIFSSKMIDVFTTISNSILDIRAVNEVIENEEFDQNRLDDHIFITIEVSGFYSGKFFIAMTKEQVARYSDFMMMGDGKASYEEDFNDAIGELFNQVMGAYITDINKRYTTTLENVGVTVGSQKPEDFDKFMYSEYLIEMDGFENSNFFIIISSDVLESVVETISGQLDNTDDVKVEPTSEDTSIEKSELDEFKKESNDTNTTKEISDFGNLNLLLDIELDVSIELGRSELSIRNLLNIKSGSIVELDKLAGEPIDILVNGKVIANGEIVIIDDSFGIRLNNLVSMQERLLSLK